MKKIRWQNIYCICKKEYFCVMFYIQHSQFKISSSLVHSGPDAKMHDLLAELCHNFNY